MFVMCGILKSGRYFMPSCASVAKVQAGLFFFLLSALLCAHKTRPKIELAIRIGLAVIYLMTAPLS